MRNLAHMHLLSTADVAHRLGVTPQTVARFVREGKLAPATQAPGRRGAYLFTPEQIDAFTSGAEPAPRVDTNPQPTEATR